MKSIQDELPLLKTIMTLIARQFGEQCEVVLHDWEQGYDHSIVAIENGHVTDRKVGDPGSNLGLTVMRGTQDDGNNFNYVTKTKTGKTIRSSTVYLKNDEGKAVGAICINYDVSKMMEMQKFVQDFTHVNDEVKEIFATDVNELLDFFLKECIDMVGKPVVDMDKEDKIKALRYLDEKGAFLITKSGTKICNFFGISKFTLYNYLDEIRGNGGDV